MLAIALVLPVMAFWPLPGVEAEELFGEPFPYGRLMYARPTISFRPTIPPKDLARLKMTLDGEPVAVLFDSEQKALVYRPETALSPGKHKVSLSCPEGAAYEWSFEVSPKALVELPLPDSSQLAALESANSLRLQLKLPPLKMDTSLATAAKLHAEYVQKQGGGQLTHTQDETSPDFLGKDATARAAAFGFQGACWENTCLTSSPRAAIQELIDAPYHRLAFLQPGEVQFGAGFASIPSSQNKGLVCGSFVFGNTGKEGVAIYPADGQQNVPIAFRGNEKPDPLRLHNAKVPVGYVISLYCFSSEDVTLEAVFASLEAEGQPVEFWLNWANNDDFLKAGVFIIPREPLKPGTTYQVAIMARTSSGSDVSRKWSFKTEPE